MENLFKVILAFGLIIGAFVYLPNIVAFGLGIGGGTVGTLSVRGGETPGLISISFDGGETFKEAAVFAPGLPSILNIDAVGGVRGAAFSNRTFYAGTDQGILISKDNGLSWYNFTDLQKNIDGVTVIYDFAFNPVDGSIYASGVKNGHGVVFKTTDNFFTATPIWTEPDQPVRAIAADYNFLYIGVSDGRLLRYSYSGGQFEKIKNFSSGIQGLNLTDGGKSILAVLGSGEAMKSNDFGSSWESMKSTGNNNNIAYFSGQGLDLAPDKGNPSVIYLASASGIFRSTNQGESWNGLNTILPNRAPIGSISADNGSIFVTTGSKLYKSGDGGANWKIKEPMPTTRRLGSLYVDNSGKLVIVGTNK